MAERHAALEDLIRGLRDESAYPHPASDVRVVQTHVSVVFLAGRFAYKIKKPVDFGFLDFTTLEQRRHFCREEVRLNRRLAADVYLGVVPVIRSSAGSGSGDSVPHVEAGSGQDARYSMVNGGDHEEGTVVEYAVKMRRLPNDATMLEHLRRGKLTESMVVRVADRVASFHSDAPGGPAVARFGRWRIVARNALENVRQGREQLGRTVSEPVFERTAELTRSALRDRREVIEERSRLGIPRDTHGDLHLDHVYFLPDRSPPDDLVVVDCIEFNRRFRYADPVADIAFLAMDLKYRGRRDLAGTLLDRYFEKRDDPGGRRVVPFYVSYRALVRAKVRGLAAEEEELSLEQRGRARREARGHWLLALDELEEPARRPGLVLVGGLPGTGKSTLASGLERSAGFRVIRSDRTRKRLAGIAEQVSAAAGFGGGIYTEKWTRRTYGACFRSAALGLCRGERIIVDATFGGHEWRRRFADLARGLGVRWAFLVTRCEESEVRRRLRRRRRRPSLSDADWEIHRAVAREWSSPSDRLRDRTFYVDTSGSQGEAVEQALVALRSIRLAGPAQRS